MYTHCICLSRLKYKSPFYRLPTLPILPVNSFIFTILPVNLKHGKSSTLIPWQRLLTYRKNNQTPTHRKTHY
jgi:hypothetical protein